MDILQLRVKNCIQTLLELEPQMSAEVRDDYDREFSFLKDCLSRIGQMKLVEEDVRKIEGATSEVIAEIGITPGPQSLYSGLVQ